MGAPYWDTAIIVGTGPSMIGFDFDRLRNRGPVLAVKEAYHDLPFCDAVFGLDLPWMRWGAEPLAALAKRKPLYLAVPDQEIDHTFIPGAIYLRRSRRCDAFSDNPDTIEAGSNSGFGAVNLAYLKRAKTIILFGFDYSGQHYCPQRYQTRPEDHNRRYLPLWADNFHATLGQLHAGGVTVINASPKSVVSAFPKFSHEQALEHLDRVRSAGG